MYRRFFIVSMITLFVSSLQGQQFKPAAIQAGDWRLYEIPTSINFALLRESAYSYQKAILNITDNEAVLSVWTSATGCSLMRIDNNANIKWRSGVPGFILGSAKWKDKVIAFYTKEWNFSNFLDGIHILEVSAIAFDLETGKKMANKVVFRNESKKAVQVVVHSKTDGEFVQLLIRQTKNGKKDSDQSWTTASVSIMRFGDNLATISTTLETTETLKGNYVGSLVNNKGETFIVTQSEKTLIAEKFDSKLNTTGRLEVDGHLLRPGVHINLNEQNDQSVIMAVRNADLRKVKLYLYDFDFSNNKVTTGDFTVDKDQVKTWKLQNKESGEKQADFDDNLINLKMEGLLQTSDKIIVLLDEITFRFQGETYDNGPTVVVFFDRKLNVLSSQAIAKNFDIGFQPPIRDWTLGSHIYGNQLLLVSNNGTKTKEQSAVITTIDLGTMKAAKPFYTERDYTRVEGGATIWFKNNFILTKCSSEKFRVVGF